MPEDITVLMSDDHPSVPTLVQRLETGELRLHDLEGVVDHETAGEVRRQFLRAQTGIDTSPIEEYSFDPASVDANIENFIGTAQIPMGIVGPLTVRGSLRDRSVYMPLATTEGALLASVNRGCSVIEAAGGATARVIESGMTRAPVFAIENVAETVDVIEWITSHEQDIIERAEATTAHGKLRSIDPYVVGDNLFLRFRYDTKDAMGMNMVTIATRAACDLIETETTAELVALSGNLCTDKKPAAINAIEGRGRTVVADVTIPQSIVVDRLHTTPAAIETVNTRKNLIGSAKAGSLGFNAHASNIIAAAFLATGQDAAQVVEGANTITAVTARDDDLYVSVSLASLEVGTVGGGTQLPTQGVGLDLLDVRGGGDPPGSNADALAEIIAAAVLAGELSLLAALASRHLSSAHEELGR